MATSESKKLLVVFGATGQQGGSVVRAILGDENASSKYSLRAVTRDINKPSAKALAEKGVECVQADMDDKESLRKALKGAYAVFSVTNFWEILDGAREKQQGINVADVAKEEGVQLFVWSNVIHAKKATNGGLPNLSHCDAKAEVGEHIESIGLPYAYVPAGFYMSNIPKGILQADDPSSPTSSYTLTFPIPGDTAKIPMFDPPSDMGKFVKAVLLLPREEVLGKSFNAATEYMSPNQIAEQFEEVTGRKCKVNRPSEDEYKQSLIKYAGFPEWMAQEYLENMLLFDEERFSGLYNGEKLATDIIPENEKLTTWRDFIRQEYKNLLPN